MPSATHSPRVRLASRLAGCLLLVTGTASGPSARAAGAPPVPESSPAPRDVLRKVVEPVVDAFSRHPDGPNRAFAIHWRVTEATAQPPELRGTRLTFLCEAPDKVYFQFLALGTMVTLCRQGQTIWMSPADRLLPLLQQVEQKPPTSEDREPLEPLRLKIPTRLFWVLFYLISVQDAGTAPLGPVPCRRVDFHPPEAKKGEFLRLWVDGADPGKMERVEIFEPDSHAALDVEDARLSVSIPASSFEPDATQRASLLNVPLERFRPLMTLLGKEEEKRRKQFIHDHPAG